MNRVFVIADTHFGHKKAIEFEYTYRPFLTIEAHDAEIVQRWNATVHKNDTVWHLGDVSLGVDGYTALRHLNGIKRLVLGNHDGKVSQKQTAYFNSIYGVGEYKNCVLTHIPVHPCQFGRYKLNIHGHLHSRMLDDNRYRCVSAEHINLTPILMTEVMNDEFYNDQKRKYRLVQSDDGVSGTQ
jgi:calcineurin-like phosphoesterase family protein